jgi:MFS transporter, ACS family, D-galactonate transporter
VNLPQSTLARPRAATRTRYWVLTALCLAAALSYVCRNAITVAESTIRGELGLSKEAMGWVMSSFFAAYALFQLPAASAGQRWGGRRMLPAVSVAWSVATAVTAATAGVLGLTLTRIGQGLAQAGLFPLSAFVISRWFPATERGFATGALGAFMSVGGAASAALTGALLAVLDWRSLFVVYSLPGVLWAAVFWIWFRDRPSDHPSMNAAELALLPAGPPVSARGRAATPWGTILGSGAMACIAAQQFFRAAGYMFFTSWFATYLQERHHVTIAKSGFLTMLPLLGVVAGGLIGGGISDWVYRRTKSFSLARRGVAVVSMGLCALAAFGAYFLRDPVAAVLVITVGSFCAAVTGPCSYAITIDLGGDHVATVNAMMNMFGNLGAMLFPLVVPWLLARTGNWDAVLLVFALLHVVAAFCWLGLRPNARIFETTPLPAT